MTKSISITSGKKGVGRANICLNLGFGLSQMGYRVCIFDVSPGIPALSNLVNVQPVSDLKEVLTGRRRLEDIIVKVSDGIDLLTFASPIREMAGMKIDRMRIIQSFSQMAHKNLFSNYDFLLINTPPGPGKSIVPLCLASADVMCVVIPEKRALIGAFQLFYNIYRQGFHGNVGLVVNQCPNAQIARKAFFKLRTLSRRNLNKEIIAFGLVHEDVNVDRSVRQKKPFIQLYPQTQASLGMRKIINKVAADGREISKRFDVVTFWKNFLDFVSLSMAETNSHDADIGNHETAEIKRPSRKEGDRVEPQAQAKRQAADKGPPRARPSDSSNGSGWYKHKDKENRWYKTDYEKPEDSEDSVELKKVSLEMLERFMVNISSVYEELRRIRRMLERDGKIMIKLELPGVRLKGTTDQNEEST